jgi:hypothetical protein
MLENATPIDHKPTSSELVVRGILEDELYRCLGIDTNAIAFRIMVALGEVLPTSVYLEYLKTEHPIH